MWRHIVRSAVHPVNIAFVRTYAQPRSSDR